MCYYLGINMLPNLSARRWTGESSFGEMAEYTEVGPALLYLRYKVIGKPCSGNKT